MVEGLLGAGYRANGYGRGRQWGLQLIQFGHGQTGEWKRRWVKGEENPFSAVMSWSANQVAKIGTTARADHHALDQGKLRF